MFSNASGSAVTKFTHTHKTHTEIAHQTKGASCAAVMTWFLGFDSVSVKQFNCNLSCGLGAHSQRALSSWVSSGVRS